MYFDLHMYKWNRCFAFLLRLGFCHLFAFCVFLLCVWKCQDSILWYLFSSAVLFPFPLGLVLCIWVLSKEDRLKLGERIALLSLHMPGLSVSHTAKATAYKHIPPTNPLESQDKVCLPPDQLTSSSTAQPGLWVCLGTGCQCANGSVLAASQALGKVWPEQTSLIWRIALTRIRGWQCTLEALTDEHFTS